MKKVIYVRTKADLVEQLEYWGCNSVLQCAKEWQSYGVTKFMPAKTYNSRFRNDWEEITIRKMER